MMLVQLKETKGKIVLVTVGFTIRKPGGGKNLARMFFEKLGPNESSSIDFRMARVQTVVNTIWHWFILSALISWIVRATV